MVLTLDVLKVNFPVPDELLIIFTGWKVSRYGVFSDLYFPVFSRNTGKYEPEKNPYLDTFYAVLQNDESFGIWLFGQFYQQMSPL